MRRGGGGTQRRGLKEMSCLSDHRGEELIEHHVEEGLALEEIVRDRSVPNKGVGELSSVAAPWGVGRGGGQRTS